MTGAANFVRNLFPLFLLAGVFGKLTDDSAARFRSRAPSRKAREAAGNHGRGMAMRRADLWRCQSLCRGVRRIPGRGRPLPGGADPPSTDPPAIALGAFTFTMTALPGTPAVQNVFPMPYFGTTLFVAPGLGVLASAIMGFGLWWLRKVEMRARAAGEG